MHTMANSFQTRNTRRKFDCSAQDIETWRGQGERMHKVFHREVRASTIKVVFKSPHLDFTKIQDVERQTSHN